MKLRRDLLMLSIIVFLSFIFVLCVYMILIYLQPEKASIMVRSTSLNEKVEESKNITKIQYYNDQGQLTYANDMGFATLIRTRKDDCIIYDYYDAYGKPVQQKAGYYSVNRKYNEQGQIELITYLDEEHNPVLISTGYAIAKQFFNTNGQLTKTLLYDTYNKPIKTYSFGYGWEFEYNDNGETESITYIDEYGAPYVCGQGFATKRMQYYKTGKERGKEEYCFYYDEEGQPIQLKLGQFGIQLHYDEFGRVSSISYLDKDGIPMINAEGYTTVKYTRYEDDTIRTEMYYDQIGKPVKLSEGQYGLLNEGKKQKYLDINGNIIINLKQSLYNSDVFVVLSCILILVFSMMLNKKMNYLLLIFYTISIIYMTLLFRSDIDIYQRNEFRSSMLSLFSNEDTYRGMLLNILLFIPLGAILYTLYPKNTIIVIPFVISVTIEVLQYFTGKGYCELIDMVCNGIGGIVGFTFARFVKLITNRIAYKEL